MSAALTRGPGRGNPRVPVLAVLALAGCLTLACDNDGDGLDDTTGQPVATREAQATGVAGCGPNGWALLCGGDPGGETTPGTQASPERMAVAARHEAGHKAIADEYGWAVLSVAIRPDGSGRTGVWGLGWKPAEERLAFYYGGAEAAGAEDGVWAEDGTGDYDRAEAILDRYPAGEADRMEVAAHAEAARIVKARADQIGRDAAALLERGRLS